jgi:hypothetical protein
LEKLRDEGVLMLSDPALPSVVNLVAGPSVKGSWWGHPKGHEVYSQVGLLEAEPDVLVTRLVSGKVTYLHRNLWLDFLSVATAREPWQFRGLSRRSQHLLDKIDKEGEVRTDRVARIHGVRESARELESRLLVYSEEIHTERGFHAKVLMTWSRCPKLRGVKVRLVEPRKAMERLSALVEELNMKYHGSGSLPWE